MRSLRRMAACGIVVTVPIAAVMFGAAPARADSIQTFQNEATGACLSGVSNIRPAYGSACGGVDDVAQRWSVHQWGDGTYQLQTTDTGLNPTGYCLDDSGPYGLRTFPCNATTFQSWYIDRPGDGSVIFRNQATGWCVDDSQDYGVRHWWCNGLNYQRYL